MRPEAMRAMTDREHAAQQLLGYLSQVGPLEAVWAMSTALSALKELPASKNHLEAVANAFAEEAQADADPKTKSSKPGTK
jgi:hypothetical protein